MIDVLVTLNEKYADQAYIMLYSLLYNNKDIKINIHVMTDDLKQDYFKKLQEEFECEFKFYYIRKEDKYKLSKLDARHLDTPTFYRLLIKDYLPHTIEKILYLDSDIVINGSLKSLLDIKFHDNEYILASEDIYILNNENKYMREINIKSGKYFNAGFILFNFSKILESNYMEKVLELLYSSKKYTYMDQDILNIVFEDKVKYLSYEWNYTSGVSNLAKKNKIKLEDSPKIIHYTGPLKGDDYLNNHQYSYLYSKYYKKAFGKKVKLKNKTLKNIIKMNLKKIEYFLKRIINKK